MGEALREAGVNTDNLTEESKRLEQEMAQLRNEQDQAADSAESFGEQAGAAFEAISSAILAAGISDRLRELESVGALDDQQKREYHNTLELLKTTMPDLADKIDTVNDSIEGGLPAVEAAVTDWQKLAEQQAKQEFATELQQELAEALKEQMWNEQQLTAAKTKGKAASDNQAEAYRRLLSALNMTEEQFKSYYGTVQDVPWRFMSEEVQQARFDYLEYGKQLQEADADQRRYAATLEQTSLPWCRTIRNCRTPWPRPPRVSAPWLQISISRPTKWPSMWPIWSRIWISARRQSRRPYRPRHY